MSRLIILCIAVCLSAVVSCDENVAYQAFAEAFRLTPQDLRNALEEVQNVSLARDVQNCLPIGVPPDVDDIRLLRPGNVRVIAAVGDSIITGMSAKDTSIINLRDWRNLSFAMGGDPGAVTVGTLLRQFSAPGFPLGLSTGIGTRTSVGNGYNAAVDGAIAQDMYEQAVWLVDRIKSNMTATNFNTYWKVVTLWIGSNNLCDLCNNRAKHAADVFQVEVDRTLAYLQANLPRTFVNLVSNLDVTQIYDFKDGNCAALHGYECPCGASSSNATRQSVKAETVEYIKRLYVLEKKYVPTKTFAVVVQPFLEQAKIPARNWLSPADCFHPSAIAHEAMAVGLWNNMITPKASKSNKLTPGELPICATANTFFTLD